MSEVHVTRQRSPYVQIPRWVVEKASAQAVKLYAVLWGYADNDTREAWPSRARLAKDMGFSTPRGTDKYIAELEDIGALEVIRRREGDVNLPNRYHLITEPRVVLKNAPLPSGSAGLPSEGSAGKSTRVVLQTAPELEPVNYNQETLDEIVVPKQEKSNVRRMATPVQDPFPVTEELEAWARDKVPSIVPYLQIETLKFVSYNQAHDRRLKDWPAAWRNWMSNAVVYASRSFTSAGRAVQHAEPATAGSKLGIDYGGWE